MPRGTRRKAPTADPLVKAKTIETEIKQPTRPTRKGSKRSRSTSRTRRTVSYQPPYLREGPHQRIQVHFESPRSPPWRQFLRDVFFWPYDPCHSMPKCAKLLACILAFVLLLLITEAVFILENKASSLFQTGFPLSPKSLSAHWYSDWRYLDAGMNLSRSGIPVVDIAYVEPLRVFDDARARYTDILKGDWETRKRNLNELEKMLKASRTGRSVWEKVRSYYWDVDTQFALESAQRNLAGLTFAGRNASTEAVCEVCEWLVRTNGGELRMKSWDVKIDEIDPQALVEITRADFEPVLGSLQRQVQDVLNHVYQEEKAMERLLSNVKRMKQGYIWNPYLLRQRNWTDVIKPVVEQTMPNTTEGKRQRKVSLMAEHADIFEHRLQQAHGHLQHTVEELNRVRDAVRMMVGKLNKDYGVYMATGHSKNHLKAYTVNDVKQVEKALGKALQESGCTKIATSCR